VHTDDFRGGGNPKTPNKFLGLVGGVALVGVNIQKNIRKPPAVPRLHMYGLSAVKGSRIAVSICTYICIYVYSSPNI
jgi:hypothetical protein